MSRSHLPSFHHPSSAPPGKAFRERYEVQSLIASGGMGAVYRVRDTVTRETVALKRINSAAAAPHDARAIESFEREYQILAGLSHPRIISVFDYGVDAQGPYYTMELVDGMDMAEAAPLSYRCRRRVTSRRSRCCTRAGGASRSQRHERAQDRAVTTSCSTSDPRAGYAEN
jgi:serine/threonine-protein kinase